MKQKLHRILFPRYENKVRSLVLEARNNKKDGDTKQTRINNLNILTRNQEEQIKSFKEKELMPKPSMADLMRDMLGATPIDFTDVESDGLPKHFLESVTEKQHEMYIAQLHQISEMEVWHAMVKHHFDTQGNYIIRVAPDELASTFSRGTFNGISLLKNDVERGHQEYIDRSKPPDDFDKFSVDLLPNLKEN